MKRNIYNNIKKKRPELPTEVRNQVNIHIKYEGYINRQLKQVEQFKRMEKFHNNYLC